MRASIGNKTLTTYESIAGHTWAQTEVSLPQSEAASARSTGIMLITLTLLLVGVVMVFSSTAVSAETLENPGSFVRSLAGRQLIYATAAVGIVLLVARIGLLWATTSSARSRVSMALFLGVVLCLVGVLIPGFSDPHRGSQRWLSLHAIGIPFSFQPSEFAKVALVIALASTLSKTREALRSFRHGFLPAALMILVCVALVGKENFGGAFILAMIGGMMLLVGGCRISHLLATGSIGLVGLIGLLAAAPYRLKRLTGYLHIWDDPQGAGFQPLQSLTSIASGGWFGTGLGTSVQKYGYLPESHCDFIFSIICEETGLAGGAMVIALFCCLVAVGAVTAWHARDRFERLLAFGLTATIGLQAATNIAVATVVTPTTGMALPFVSAGGSSVIAFSVAIGLLVWVARRQVTVNE